MLRWCILGLLAFSGCGTDADGDGIDAAIDCDDSDPSVGLPPKWYPDTDGDTWGASQGAVQQCTPPEGYTHRDGDCDDQTELANPDVTETCDGLGLDDDCDGLIDDDDPSVDPATTKTWYTDADGDGFGVSTGASWQACDGGPHGASNTDDCDDNNALINPAMAEVCDLADADEDCNGRSDDDDPGIDSSVLIAWAPDADGDGYGEEGGADTWQCASPGATHSNDLTDCDDTNPDINPAAAEICDDNDVDEDCDGLADDADSSVDPATFIAWAPDADGDGYGEEGGEDTWQCASPGSTHAAEATDCDDTDAAISPDGIDGLLWDRDCDGAVASDRSLANAEHTLTGETSGDDAGSQVSGAGDVDGDGHPDLMIGAPGYSSEQGAVYVVLSSSLSSPTLDLGSADHTLLGENTGDDVGHVFSAAGDVDGDGLGDLLVGAQYNDESASYAGRAYLLLGSSLGGGALNLGDADYQIDGSAAFDYVGVAVARAGDVDGDGYSDVLIGSVNGGSNGDGEAYLFFGDRFGSADSINASDADIVLIGEGDVPTGTAVSTAGDTDGDGLDDLLIGTRTAGYDDVSHEIGRAYLIQASSLSGAAFDLGDADCRFDGQRAADHAGDSVATAGDIDADGYDDVLILATGHSKLYAVLGGSLGSDTTFALADADIVLPGPSPISTEIRHTGDVDGDGQDDVLVSHTNASGPSYLFLGDSIGTGGTYTAADADHGTTAPGTGWSGLRAAGVGDVDGNGRDDLLFGAQDTGAGAAYLVFSGL